VYRPPFVPEAAQKVGVAHDTEARLAPELTGTGWDQLARTAVVGVGGTVVVVSVVGGAVVGGDEVVVVTLPAALPVDFSPWEMR